MVGSIASLIEKVTKYLDRFGLIVALPAMMAMVTINVIGRYVFNFPFQGFDEICDHLLVVVVFLGFADCWIEEGHIKVELLQERLGDRSRTLTEILAEAVGLAFFIPLTVQNYSDFFNSIERMEKLLDINVPEWPFRLVACTGGTLMCLVLLISMTKSVSKMARK